MTYFFLDGNKPLRTLLRNGCNLCLIDLDHFNFPSATIWGLRFCVDFNICTNYKQIRYSSVYSILEEKGIFLNFPYADTATSFE